MHWGEPEMPTKLRAYTSSLLKKDPTPESSGFGLNNFTDHEIGNWYGFSYKLKFFLGVWVFSKTSYPTEEGPIPYRDWSRK